MSEMIEFLSPQAIEQLTAANALVDKLADKIKEINSFKAPNSPSGGDAAVKSMANSYKEQGKSIEQVRKELQKLSDAEKDAASKKQASINAEWAAYEKTKKKEKDASDKLLATEIENAEKSAKAQIDKNNKILQAVEKRAEREKQIEDKKAASIAAAQQRQLERQDKIDARNSRTGASSVVPGMSTKIAEIKETEKLALANEKLSGAYFKIKSARDAAASNLQNLIASEKASTAEIKKAQREYDILSAKVAKADQAIGKMSMSNSLKGLTSQVSNLVSAFGVAGGIYLFAQVAKDVYETTKRLQSLDLALKMVSGSTEAFASNQEFLSTLAEQYGIEIKSLTKNFTEFWVASKGKLEAEEIKAVFTSISKAGALMGLSLEAQDSAFLALQQMMSKGTVQAEELKKQLGNALPGAIKAATMAYQALHPELKVTEKLFMEQMKAGKVISAELLPELAKQFEILYGIENVNRANTLMAAQERLSNSWTNMVRAMNEGDTGGISTFFKVVIDGLTTITTLAGMLFKGESSLSKQFKSIGAGQAADELDKYREKFKEFEEETRNFMDEQFLETQRKNIIEQQKIIKEQQELRKSLMGGNRALFHLQTKAEEDALVSLGKSAAIIKMINSEKLKSDKSLVVSQPTKTKAELKKEAQDAEKLLKDRYDLEISDIKRKIEIAKDEFKIKEELNKDELSYFAEGVAKKLSLSMRLATLEIELAQRVSKEKKRLAQGNVALGITPTIGGDKVAQNEYNTEAENVALAHVDRMDKINKDYFKSMADVVPKDWSSKTPTMWTPEQIKQAEEDAKKIAEIQKRLKDEFRNYIQSFEQDFLSNAGFGETFDFFIRMDEDGKTMFDKLNQLADGSSEKFAATFQAISESAQEAFNFISVASQQNFDEQYARLEQERDVAILFAGESAAARNEIQEQYEQRRKQIARREAKAKQQQAIFNIAIDTAQALVAQLAATPLPFGTGFLAIIAALGAAQIAMVASQKIPQYYKGTDNAEGGLAWTQEKGREIITDSQGRVKSTGSDKGAELTMLAKGDKVFTAEKSAMMFDNSLNSMLLNNGVVMPKVEISMDAEKITNEIKSLANTIASKESFSIVRDAKGERIYQRTQNERKELLNNILNVRTYGV